MEFAKDAGPMPAGVRRVAQEAEGVQQHTPQTGICQRIHEAFSLEAGPVVWIAGQG